MISSEVQRTLVKSPPELWSELSDPDALARHLGALGDVSITRAEPERLVEWQADGASGVVQLKASGWGTRVTLSVTKQLEPSSEDATDGHAHEDWDTDEPANAGPTGSDTEGDIRPTAVPALEPEAAADIEQAPEMAAAAPAPSRIAPKSSGWAGAADCAATPNDTAPAAAPPAAFTAPEIDAERAIEAQPSLPADTADSPLPVSGTLAAPAAAEPERAPAPPRRGFFARLFGRRASAEPRAAAARTQATPDATCSSPSPPESSATADASAAQVVSAIELLQARFAPAEPSAEPPAATTAADATPAPASHPAPLLAPEVELATSSPDGASPAYGRHDAAPDAGAQTTSEPPSAGKTDAAAHGPTDLAAELRAAEEQATEEVTAVLTGVLDRLGAAHHRPFSRS